MNAVAIVINHQRLWHLDRTLTTIRKQLARQPEDRVLLEGAKRTMESILDVRRDIQRLGSMPTNRGWTEPAPEIRTAR